MFGRRRRNSSSSRPGSTVALCTRVSSSWEPGSEVSSSRRCSPKDSARTRRSSSVDRSDAFVFGYSKLDVMFGRVRPEEIRLPYADFVKPGVRLLRETVTAIEPESRQVTTEEGVREGDVLVVALGADYDFEATPGLAEGENEFYSVAGAERLREILPTFAEGRAVVGVCGAPFKCPPAPERSGAAPPRLPDRARRARRLRDHARDALRHAGPALAGHVGRAARGLRRARHRVRAPTSRARARHHPCRGGARRRPASSRATSSSASRSTALPTWSSQSGMAEDGYIPVDSRTLADAVSGRLRRRRRGHAGHPEGGRLL